MLVHPAPEQKINMARSTRRRTKNCLLRWNHASWLFVFLLVLLLLTVRTLNMHSTIGHDHDGDSSLNMQDAHEHMILSAISSRQQERRRQQHRQPTKMATTRATTKPVLRVSVQRTEIKRNATIDECRGNRYDVRSLQHIKKQIPYLHLPFQNLHMGKAGGGKYAA